MNWPTRGRAHVLGYDVPHDGGVINFEMVISRVTEPELLVPKLFFELDPTLVHRLQPGDFIVAGRNFLSGKAHNNGLIGIKALNLRVLCESMPLRAFQGAVGLALPCLTHCAGITTWVKDGDELEVNMLTGSVNNLSKGETRCFPSLPPAVVDLIEQDGTQGLLQRHLRDHPELAVRFEDDVAANKAAL